MRHMSDINDHSFASPSDCARRMEIPPSNSKRMMAVSIAPVYPKHVTTIK